MKSKRKNKKAQFFIIGAVLLALILAGLFVTTNYLTGQQDTRFYDLSQNFKQESIKVIDTGIYTQENLSLYIENFTTTYLGYGIQQEPGIELVYVYGNSTEFSIFNFAENTTEIYVGDEQGSYTKQGDVVGGRQQIKSKVSLAGFKKTVVQDLASFTESFKIKSSGKKIKLKISNQEYKFDLDKDEKFLIIMKTQKGNETYVAS